MYVVGYVSVRFLPKKCHILAVASYISYVYWNVNLYLIVDTNFLSRSLYIARFWKKSLTPLIHLPDIEEYGWFADGRITWVIESYPKEVEEIMDDSILRTTIIMKEM